MSDPAREALEVAQAIHSLLENWSIDVFLAVVAMDVFLHLTEDTATLEWRAAWNGFSIRGFRVAAYNGRVSLRAIVKTLSLIGFGAAIALEFVAIPYGERVDKLTGEDAVRSQRQVASAFVMAANSNKEAGEAKERAATAEDRAVQANLELAKLKTPRTLDSVEQMEMVSALRPFAKTQFMLAVDPLPESINLLNTLAAILTSAGWKWIPVKTPLLPTIGPWSAAIWYRSGIAVTFRIRNRGLLTPAADALALAIEGTNLKSKLETGLVPETNDLAYVPEDAILLIVGSHQPEDPDRENTTSHAKK